MATSDPESTAKSADELAWAAEEEALAAEARAEAARARAEELRRQIAGPDIPTAGPATPTADAAIPAAEPTELTGSTAAPSASAMPAVAVGVAALLTVGLLAATGYMAWQHQKDSRQRQSAAEFAAAARQDVINLMSIDYNTAQDSVQRVLDGSTGRFRENFADTADEFVKALKDEQIVTKATVNDAAVESITGDSAVVLVSATSHREGPKAPKDQQEPRLWRIVVNLERDGGQIKMTGIEFV